MEGIVDISLDNQKKNKKKTKTALSILLSPDRVIHDCLVNSETRILEKMAYIAHEKNDNSFSFRRVLQIINLSIQVSHYWEQAFPDSLNFIIKYVREIENPCVYDFFEAICSNNKCYSSVQLWLSKEGNIHTILLNELESIKEKKKKKKIQKKKS